MGDHWTYALQIVHQTYMGPSDVRYFLNTLWVILGHMKHLLDQYTQTTGHTLGLPKVRCSVRELVADFSINSPPLPFIPHAFFFPWYAPRLPEPFLGVLREKSIRKNVDGEFRGKGNMSVLSFGVRSISFCCYHLVILWLCLNTDFKVVIVLLLELSTFSKSFHQRICKIVISYVACPVLLT
jgi:hypothetical protein